MNHKSKTVNRDEVTHSTKGGTVLAIIPLGIALNLLIGTVVHTLKAPVYLDACGTIIVTLLIGWRAGSIVGVASFLLGGMLTNPVLPWFCGTQVAIAIFVHFIAAHGGLRTYTRIIACGIGLGVVAGIISAPVIVYLFGGITGSGASLIVAFLLASGKSIVKSVILSGLAAEPIDKTLQLLLVVWLLKGMPQTLLTRFNSNLLEANGFTHVSRA